MKGARRCLALLLVLGFAQTAGAMPASARETRETREPAGVTRAAGAPSPDDPTAHRTIGIRLLDAPESRRADPRAQAYIVDHLAPGSTIERRVEVFNESPEPMHVDLYAAAATIAKGRFTFARGRTPDELTGWTSLDRTGLDLAASATARVRTTIRVPKDAAEGERYGVVWAQTGTPADRSHTVTMLGRVGVRMYIDVGPGGEPPSDFKIDGIRSTRAADGRAEVHARIHNTGGRALDISGALSLRDGPSGLRAGPFAARTGTSLAPGDAAEVVVPLDARLPDGPWTVALTARSGLVERTARAKVTFPDSPEAAGEVVASVTQQGQLLGRFPTLVAVGLSALLLVALCLPVSRFLRRRR
ncbi:peptidase [Streptomyces sp. NPDC002667]|uniref:COG1470 family protein n=1 Tax=Streptomyces sp. NPDC002667 TaxID=3364657 RepID=UPI00368C0213